MGGGSIKIKKVHTTKSNYLMHIITNIGDKISSNEKEIIDTIIKLLKNKNVTDISEMSHREDGWKKTKRFEQISFEYAMNLKLIK